ncbi:hypothetical protein AB7W88_18160 [Providencia vermicola]|uniref:Lipoprotein n=2 Tax=Providencia TaxID=586 RepID=A0AAI9I346_PROST|nr:MULTISPECIES: hypothetical protein [Providencia]ELR5037591.1 hypothetical protein [Providencia stuartii]ELR5120141.1 hypothetical protein [Providencia stuartii]ELR5143572.1 hypothetical protein [Providencia stuartii]ELR5292257.1 hypothetical protein [Providencia stuartii]ELX8378768.1 hypothetical protein [Providencia stuartii]
MRIGLLTALIVVLSGCSTPSPDDKKEVQVKSDPYEDSVLNTIKKNQDIYKKQQESKPR